MLSTLTASDQILAIHQHLQKQAKMVVPAYYSKLQRTVKLGTIEKNPPEFHQRLPNSVTRRFDLRMESSKREGTLISPHAYRVLRQFQMERIMTSSIVRNNPRPTNILIQTQSPEGQALKLKYPILIGGNGELVAIMKTGKQQLGEGNFGTVFVGMDLDTHKFIALKYHDLAKSKLSRIRKENAVMDEIGRLVTYLETESVMITADELAWGCEYTQMMIDRNNNALDIEEILYRLDMAIKFFEQVKIFNEKGFLNRDVKLDNMIWDPLTKTATMIDFGFAKKAFRIENDAVNGSPIYMAPEVEEGTYSLASDAYACGVALIEMFTNKDIFDHVDKWRLTLDAYLQKKDPNVMINFFKMAAPDLLDNDNPDISKHLKPIANIIKSLTNPNEKHRMPLQDALSALRSYYERLGFLNFKERSLKADKSSPLQLTTEDLLNERIRYYVAQEILDEEKLKLISPDSLLIILQRAVNDKNMLVFENIMKHAALFDKQHQAFAQLLLKQAFKAFKEEDLDMQEEGLISQTRHLTISPMLRRSPRLCAEKPLLECDEVQSCKRKMNTFH